MVTLPCGTGATAASANDVCRYVGTLTNDTGVTGACENEVRWPVGSLTSYTEASTGVCHHILFTRDFEYTPRGSEFCFAVLVGLNSTSVVVK